MEHVKLRRVKNGAMYKKYKIFQKDKNYKSVYFIELY